MISKYKVFGWGAALSWVGLATYCVSKAKMKLSVKDLMLMMPQCSEMTDLAGNGYFSFSPETMIKFCFGFVLLHFVTWWMTAEDVVEKRENEVSNIVKYIERQIFKEEATEDLLLDSSKTLVDNIEVEFEHCAALIGANNETPGQRVGGEVEWATGETTSEDEDATREIIGAHIKTRKEPENERFIRSIDFNETKSKSRVKEPHLRCDLRCDLSDDTNYGKSETSFL